MFFSACRINSAIFIGSGFPARDLVCKPDYIPRRRLWPACVAGRIEIQGTTPMRAPDCRADAAHRFNRIFPSGVET
jgi:hypothetical protein